MNEAYLLSIINLYLNNESAKCKTNLSLVKETEAYDLLGNTVCVPVIEKISERIAEEWKKQR